MLITVVLLANCVFSPVRIAFYETDDLTWTIINDTVDFIFFLDIIVSFNSAYFNEDFSLVDDR